MKISALTKCAAILAAFLAAQATHASTITSFSNSFGINIDPIAPLQFSFGVNENLPAGNEPWDIAILTIESFTNSIWGTTYTLNAATTPIFAAFVSQLTDGELDWIGYRIVTAAGDGGSGYSSETARLAGRPGGPFSVDLAGHSIDGITISFAEDHALDFLDQEWQVRAQYTVTFFGDASSHAVPESDSTLALIVAAASLLCVLRRFPGFS